MKGTSNVKTVARTTKAARRAQVNDKPQVKPAVPGSTKAVRPGRKPTARLQGKSIDNPGSTSPRRGRPPKTAVQAAPTKQEFVAAHVAATSDNWLQEPNDPIYRDEFTRGDFLVLGLIMAVVFVAGLIVGVLL